MWRINLDKCKWTLLEEDEDCEMYIQIHRPADPKPLDRCLSSKKGRGYRTGHSWNGSEGAVMMLQLQNVPAGVDNGRDEYNRRFIWKLSNYYDPFEEIR